MTINEMHYETFVAECIEVKAQEDLRKVLHSERESLLARVRREARGTRQERLNTILAALAPIDERIAQAEAEIASHRDAADTAWGTYEAVRLGYPRMK